MIKEKKKNKLVKILNRIATPPADSSWYWGEYRSLLSFVLLWVLWIFRILSLMQIIKAVYRGIKEYSHGMGRLKQLSVDGKSKRVNIPPMFQEIYFLSWLVILIVLWSLKVILVVVNYYVLMESFVWVLYYTVFRRFFEEVYSAYHPLEHLTVILVIIPTQALAISQLYHATFTHAMLALIGSSENDLPFYVNLLGVMYMATAVIMIMSGFPSEKHKSDNALKIAIIGSGDVVINRLLPALKKRISRRWLHIFTSCAPDIHDVGIDIIGEKCKTKSNRNVAKPSKPLSESIKEISKYPMVWIATPSTTHIFYLERLLNSSAFIVVEKPITVIKDEIVILKRIVQSSYRNRIFFLSYYLLEKALPLTYIKMPSTYYEKYLKFFTIKNLTPEHNGLLPEDYPICGEMKRDDLLRSVDSLGKIRDIYIYIIEGQDDREWAYSSDNGGQFLETFLHNVIIATLFAGLPENWSKLNLSCGKFNRESPDIISLEAVSEDIKIHLLMAKDIDNPKKHGSGAHLEFQNGEIFADFKKCHAVVKLRGQDKPILIATDHTEFPDKYDIQVDLALRCYEKELSSEFVDGLVNQIEIIEWLLKLSERKYDVLNPEDAEKKIDMMLRHREKF